MPVAKMFDTASAVFIPDTKPASVRASAQVRAQMRSQRSANHLPILDSLFIYLETLDDLQNLKEVILECQHPLVGL